MKSTAILVTILLSCTFVSHGQSTHATLKHDTLVYDNGVALTKKGNYFLAKTNRPRYTFCFSNKEMRDGTQLDSAYHLTGFYIAKISRKKDKYFLACVIGAPESKIGQKFYIDVEGALKNQEFYLISANKN